MTPAVLESGELPHEKDSKNPASSESEKFPKNSKKIASSKSRKASKASNPKLGIIQKVAGEFQESQCYFFLATHTAAFVGISRSDIFKSTNARQATANCDFILVMAEVSSVMNYLGITICSLANVSSKWTQFLSVVSLIFSLVVVGLTNTQEGVCGTKSLIILNPLDSRPAGSRSVSACGGNSPPNVYCGGLSSANLNRRPDVFNRWVEFWGWFGLLISCVIFVLFLIMMFYKGSKGSRKVKWPPYPGWISRKYFNFNNFQRILLFLLLVASVFAVYILATLAKGYIDFEDWGIGQIIALFVWVPVVAHWVRWSISKLFRFLTTPSRLFPRPFF